MVDNEELSDEFRKFFKMPLSPVSITIHTDEVNLEPPEESTRFCRFVRKSAELRESYSIEEENLSNFTAPVILGFSEPRYTDVRPRIEPSETKAVTIGPLENEKAEPDVVVVITNPATMMEVLQVYHQMSGERLESSCTSKGSAIAGEATALPYMEGKPNLTLLCGGARSIGGFEEDELAIGFPYDIFQKLVEQLSEPDVTDALCGCIMDDLPKQVVQGLENLDFDKGTDHFHGYYKGEALRLYLNQDESGSINKLTVFSPIKFESEEEAKEAEKIARPMIAPVGFSDRNENWLDLGMIENYEDGLKELALDEEKFEKELRELFEEFLEIVDKVKAKQTG